MSNLLHRFLFIVATLGFFALSLPTPPVNADPSADTTKQIVETPISAAPTYAKRALVIGIDGYQNVAKLVDCDNDAHQFATYLRKNLGFTDVTVMTDDQATPENLQPTYTHITRQFNLLLNNIVAKQTQIVVFYSGHGVRTQNDQDGDADWLVPIDADPNDISHTCYDYSRFKSMLDTKQPARALLIMDACRNILTGKAAVGGSGFGGKQVPLGPQIAELLSCQPTQTSLEGDPHDFSESIFTHFLLKGLAGDPQAIDPNTNAVTFDSLMAYVQGQVTQYAQTRLNSAQQPTGDASFGGMVLASFGSLPSPAPITLIPGPPSHSTQPVPSPASGKPKLTTDQQKVANTLLTGLWTDAVGNFSETKAKLMTADAVKLALADGADVNAADSDGSTALLCAAAYGHSDIVQILMAAGADVRATDKDGDTALMAATIGGDSDLVKSLLEAGLNVNAADKTGQTALMTAAVFAHPDIVNELLAAGAEVDLKDHDGHSALWHAQRPDSNASSADKDATIAALKAVWPKDKPMDLSPTETPLVSLQNLQSLGTALREYLQDYDGKLPRLTGHDDVKAALIPYLPSDKGPAMLIDPADGIPYSVNILVSGRKVASFKNPSHVVFLYETLQEPGGIRAVLFLDGTAKRLSNDDWIRYQRASGMIPE